MHLLVVWQEVQAQLIVQHRPAYAGELSLRRAYRVAGDALGTTLKAGFASAAPASVGTRAAAAALPSDPGVPGDHHRRVYLPPCAQRQRRVGFAAPPMVAMHFGAARGGADIRTAHQLRVGEVAHHLCEIPLMQRASLHQVPDGSADGVVMEIQSPGGATRRRRGYQCAAHGSRRFSSLIAAAPSARCARSPASW